MNVTNNSDSRSRHQHAPANGRRVFDDAHRIGLELARQMVERFGRLAESELGGRRPPPSTLADGAAAMVRVARELWAPHRAARPDSDPSLGDVVDLGSVDPGATARGVAYVQTRGELAPGLSCSPLGTCGGQRLERVRIDESPHDAAGSSRQVTSEVMIEVTIEVEVPVTAAPGTYHGLLLAQADPDQALRVVLRVTGS